MENKAQVLELIKKRLNNKVAILKTRQEKFIEDFKQNPCYALEWSKNTFKDAACLRVFSNALTLLDKTIDIEKEISHLKSEILRAAANCANQSTSQTSNLMDQSMLEAKTELLGVLSILEGELV